MYWVEKILGRMLMLSMVSQCQCPARAGHAPFISPQGGTKESERVTNERTKWERKEEETEEKRRTEKLTPATCPACDKVVKANFMQLQIRSADEPMTTF
jgi:DNA-directed RNA polymerase subunit M/transcription elongation factor TFIIS